MRSLLPSVDEVDAASAYAYPTPLTRPWVRANMVASVDGAAQLEGRSGGLSSGVDRHVFATLRGLADAVLVGAGTARVEGYRALRPKPAVAELRAGLGLQPAPTLVVVSGRLDLSAASELFHGGHARTIVATVARSDRDRRAELAEVADIVVAGETTLDIPALMAALGERQLLRVLCEGGPRLLADITRAGCLDELCLTVEPRLVAGDAKRVLDGPPADAPLALAHLLEQDGTLLARYVRAEAGGD